MSRHEADLIRLIRGFTGLVTHQGRIKQTFKSINSMKSLGDVMELIISLNI